MKGTIRNVTPPKYHSLQFVETPSPGKRKISAAYETQAFTNSDEENVTVDTDGVPILPLSKKKRTEVTAVSLPAPAPVVVVSAVEAPVALPPPVPAPVQLGSSLCTVSALEDGIYYVTGLGVVQVLYQMNKKRIVYLRFFMPTRLFSTCLSSARPAFTWASLPNELTSVHLPQIQGTS